MFPIWARTHALDTGEAVNVLKGAIVTSDRILTVSQVIDFTYSIPLSGVHEMSDVRYIIF